MVVNNFKSEVAHGKFFLSLGFSFLHFIPKQISQM